MVASDFDFASCPAVLTVEEVARALRIGRNAAYDAVRAGQIPSFRLGNKIRVPRAALERMLQTGADLGNNQQ